MTLARVTNHVEAGLDLLLEQYKGKPRIAALITSELEQIQKLEDAIWEVILGRLIDTAVGVQLDALGKIVGQKRQGAGDEVFRARIRARIWANRSLGHPDDIIKVVQLATGLPDDEWTYTENYPAGFIIEIFGAIDASIVPVVAELVRVAKPPGVGFSVLFSGVPEGETFAFSDTDDIMIDADRGFADDDPLEAPGGRWIDVS